MQMMPKTSWPQRIGEEATASDRTVVDGASKSGRDTARLVKTDNPTVAVDIFLSQLLFSFRNAFLSHGRDAKLVAAIAKQPAANQSPEKLIKSRKIDKPHRGVLAQ
jgi:hypothetical protein